MSDETQSIRDNALDFLDELDGRHDFLLGELEQLNIRIDSVLNEYSLGRKTAAIANGVSVKCSRDNNDSGVAINSGFEAADSD